MGPPMKRPSPAVPTAPINPHTLRSFGRPSQDVKTFQPGSTCWLLYWPEEGLNPEYLPCIVVDHVDEYLGGDPLVDVSVATEDGDVPQFLRVVSGNSAAAVP